MSKPEMTARELRHYLKTWHRDCMADKEPCEACPEDKTVLCIKTEQALLRLVEKVEKWKLLVELAFQAEDVLIRNVKLRGIANDIRDYAYGGEEG